MGDPWLVSRPTESGFTTRNLCIHSRVFGGLLCRATALDSQKRWSGPRVPFRAAATWALIARELFYYAAFEELEDGFRQCEQLNSNGSDKGSLRGQCTSW